VSLVQGGLWLDGGDWIISCGASTQIWCCRVSALFMRLNIVHRFLSPWWRRR
jgi:hypothetical protein